MVNKAALNLDKHEIRKAGTGENRVAFSFGRFNPPTSGHEKLILSAFDVAKNLGGWHIIFPSQSHDNDRNPLEWHYKIRLLREVFPGANISDNKNIRTPYEALEYLIKEKKCDVVTFVVGGDRVEDFRPMRKYAIYDMNARYFDIFSVDREDVDASSSEAREYVRNNDFESFFNIMPTRMNEDLAKDVFARVKSNLR